MKRQIFCYLIFSLEILFLSIFAFIMFYSYHNNWKVKEYSFLLVFSIISLLVLIFPLFIALLYFGTPKNSIREMRIKQNIFQSSNDNFIKICYENEKKIWQCKYFNKIIKFNFNGWINQKQRIIDIIYIQLHNLYFNEKKLKNVLYIKILKFDIKVKFEKNDFLSVKKIKPSLILRFKLLLAISSFRNHSVPQKKHWNRDLYDTFLIVE